MFLNFLVNEWMSILVILVCMLFVGVLYLHAKDEAENEQIR
jgi:hypothetical protein